MSDNAPGDDHRPAATISRSLDPSPRKRKPNPLPYKVPDSLELQCQLCGPPFQIFDSIQGMDVCSFECAKRYVEMALAHNRGFKVKHGKTEPTGGILGRGGITRF